MSTLIGAVIAAIISAIGTALISYFKKPPEQVQREEDEKKEAAVIDNIADPNNHSYVVRPNDDDWAKPKDTAKKV
jgi:hypothetical protein